ncbi:hypothetical protein, partial [Zooshikella harenae]
AIVNGIENVDGYFLTNAKEDGLFDYIVYGLYEFIEYEHAKNKLGSPVNGLPYGYYRDYKALKNDPNCNPYYLKEIKKKSNVEPYVSFRKQYCVATVKIDSFKSKYQYESVSEELIDNKTEGYEIHRSVTKVENIQTKEILGQSISYLLFPYGIYKTPESYMTSQCSRINKFKYLPIKKSIDAWVFNKE